MLLNTSFFSNSAFKTRFSNLMRISGGGGGCRLGLADTRSTHAPQKSEKGVVHPTPALEEKKDFSLAIFTWTLLGKIESLNHSTKIRGVVDQRNKQNKLSGHGKKPPD